MSSSVALFLDRDGVINVDSSYVHRIEDFHWIEGIFDTVRTARLLGLEVVVVTNQAGIARGHYTEEQYQALTAWMRAQFERQNAPLSAVYHCPYHPDGIGRYRGESPCRKPAPGMLMDAARELRLDLAASVLIGNNESDIAAGIAAGLRANALLQISGAVHLDTGASVIAGASVITGASAILRSHVEATAWLRRIYS
jgi:D-glycero-D-manno-heptose 1,7-bisphosphate phosphatase